MSSGKTLNTGEKMNTKHSTNCKMSFGRKDPTCPRCRELLAGSAPRSWNVGKRSLEEKRLEAIRTHDCKKCGCGPVCTAFDW